MFLLYVISNKKGNKMLYYSMMILGLKFLITFILIFVIYNT